ncbi:carnosine N-methyltransferase [[Candida] railenensis]|uniref:carnosine N-methyltransferase n=1 Tax=[Candida] railenensis TaxID=45579 RepID=A0A9P0QQK1_9ASCO|nr:carnosine N-methyltransferase [[Candida] railenensis]
MADEEYKALTSTLSAFYSYGKYTFQDLIAPRRVKVNSIPPKDLELIPWYPKHLENLTECLHMNEDFTKKLALSVAEDWGAPSDPSQWAEPQTQDFDKVRSILLQLTREWSEDGASERNVAFDKVIDEVCGLYPDISTRQGVKVLIPGCGTGRLVFEFVKRGFWCQGNEFSYHMLLASNFVLNHSFVAHNYSIFPFIHKFSNLIKRSNQIRPITIPDINPTEITDLERANPSIPYTDLMSMTAGSFVDLYGPEDLNVINDTYSDDDQAKQFRSANSETFDVLVSCYFLDTASNIIEYLKAIHHTLKTGGVWINFGPLLWHFEEDGNMTYITRKNEDGQDEKVPSAMKGFELSREDLLELVEKIGFTIEKVEDEIPTNYCTDPRSLGGFEYKCVYWVARKI